MKNIKDVENVKANADYTEEKTPFDDVLRQILSAKPKPKKALKPKPKKGKANES